MKRLSSFVPDPLPEDKLPSKVRWDGRYVQLRPADRTKIAPLLASWLPELPGRGRALDIAAGAGRHSIALARRGLAVDAVDISIQGLRLLQRRAEPALSIQPIVLDLERGWLPPGPYQVIVNFFYLERAVWPLIEEGLAPGGWLIFETFTVEQLILPNKKYVRREFLLERNELGEAFEFLDMVYYDEGIHRGKATAQLVGRKQL